MSTAHSERLEVRVTNKVIRISGLFSVSEVLWV
jgi:hypothetical protein